VKLTLTAILLISQTAILGCASFNGIQWFDADGGNQDNVIYNVDLQDTVLTAKVHNETVMDSLSQNSNGKLNGNGFILTTNRLPQLLNDVKVFLSDAIIADVHNDTFEVIYNIDRVFDLLAEADQLGEMNDDDREEFDRFELSLIEVYTNRLATLQASDVPYTADQLRHEITTVIEPTEIEMGNSKFTVIDDRDGHIPLIRNHKVDQFIKFFQTKGRKQFDIWLTRKAQYENMILGIINDYSLPEELIYLAMIESGLNPKAYSRANAVGMWQFVYSTGKLYGLDRTWYVDERRDPIKATRAACEYLQDLYKEFDNWYLALAAYNSGEGRVARAVRFHQTSDFWQLHSLPRETRNYMPYFLAAAIIGRNPEQYGFKNGTGRSIDYDLVELEKSADLSVIARSAKISLKTLKEYNPELRQSATPNNGPYGLKLPKGTKNVFVANYNKLPETQRFAPQYVRHRVKKGESLWSIAKKYRISIHDLAAVNKIRNRHRIKIGQILTVPVRGQSFAGAKQSSNNGPPGQTQITYTVRKGDTLGHIAENYKTRARTIRSWNGLKYGDHIYPGQKLILWVKEG
jgi:membrane-bound lytic murein transglycosylase D